METETYFAICKAQGFAIDELNSLTVGFVLDTVEVILEMKNPDGNKKGNSGGGIIKANQSDFDSF